MIGDASEFTPLDLLGTLALNAGMTHLACTNKSGSFRLGIMSKKTGDVPVFADFRFLGGIGSALAASFGGPMVRRVGHDLATGLLGSYVATETCRRQAIKRETYRRQEIKRIEAAGPDAVPQITEQLDGQLDEQPVKQPVGQPELAGDYDW